MLRRSLVCCGLLLAAMWAAAFTSPATAESTKLCVSTRGNDSSSGTLPIDCQFSDDFNDGIWVKYNKNPILTRTEPWEARCICEPNVISEDGIIKMWFMGCSTSTGTNAAVGYATSKDGFAWKKHPGNPICSDPKEAVIRPSITKHKDKYYLFTSDWQFTDALGIISRWTSKDGLHWGDKVAILQPTQPWEGPLHNTAVVIDEEGTWQMLYVASTCDEIGYAHSPDGVHWTKYKKNPVISVRPRRCGDPCLRKIGNRYFVWYSKCALPKGDACTFCLWSEDMIHWNPIYNGPQIGFTQPWEHGRGRPEAHYSCLITDPDVVEHNGKVFLYYQGAQNPFGVAVFDGTLVQLTERLLNKPPLLKWEESPYVSVENKELKISENATDKKPFVEKVATFNDRVGYAFEFRARCYAGASHQIKPVMRYVDKRNYARFWIMNNDTTWYQECRDGRLGGTANIGANNICDSKWHDWKIVVKGADNTLYLDGRLIGKWQSNPVFVNRNDLRIGFGVFDTYAAFDDVKVTNSDLERSVAKWQDK